MYLLCPSAKSVSKARDDLLDPQYGFLKGLQDRGDEIKIKKVISEQGGKPIKGDTLGVMQEQYWRKQ